MNSGTIAAVAVVGLVGGAVLLSSLSARNQARQSDPSGVGEIEPEGWFPRGWLPWLIPKWGGKRDISCWPIREKRGTYLCKVW